MTNSLPSTHKNLPNNLVPKHSHQQYQQLKTLDGMNLKHPPINHSKKYLTLSGYNLLENFRNDLESEQGRQKVDTFIRQHNVFLKFDFILRHEIGLPSIRQKWLDSFPSRGHPNYVFNVLIVCMCSGGVSDKVLLGFFKKWFIKKKFQVSPQWICNYVKEYGIKALGNEWKRISRQYKCAGYVYEAAAKIVEEYNGQVPCDYYKLIEFKGMASKMALLFLQGAYDKWNVGFPNDRHTHQIFQIFGLVF